MLSLTPISENALFCSPEHDSLSLPVQRKLWAFAEAVRRLPDTAEAVVGMNNLTVFHRHGSRRDALCERLQQLWQDTEAAEFQGKHITIPVSYGGADGADLHEVAAFHGISAEEVVARHTAPTYTVFMMGFQPGFPYLFGLPKHLHTPRRDVPRTEVPAGSVGIGGSQTGVYPFASPGGWQIIGRTVQPLFQAAAQPPTLLAAGDTVSFTVASFHG